MTDKKDREPWKLWDVLFTNGILSFLKDSHEAQSDKKKVKQLLLQMIFGIVLAAGVFMIISWIA